MVRKATHKKPSNVFPAGRTILTSLWARGKWAFAIPTGQDGYPLTLGSQGKNTDEATLNSEPVPCGLWLNHWINGKQCFDREDDTVPTKILISGGTGSKASGMRMP